STSRPAAGRRPGRTRHRVIPRPRRTSGGTGTTTTAPRAHRTPSGSRCPIPKKPPGENPTQSRKYDRPVRSGRTCRRRDLRSELLDYDAPLVVHKDVIAITVLAGCRVVAVGVAFRVDHLIARKSLQRDRRLEVLARRGTLGRDEPARA